MATFTTIRAPHRTNSVCLAPAEVRPRVGHLVWVTCITGERFKVLVSTGTNNQSCNVTLAVSGHNIALVRGDDMLGRKDWRRYPGRAAQAVIDRLERRNGVLVADTLRQASITGPFLNPEVL